MHHIELRVIYEGMQIAKINSLDVPRSGDLIGIGNTLYEVQGVVWVDSEGEIQHVELQVRPRADIPHLDDDEDDASADDEASE